MADVISGPVTTLPGARHRLPPGETCDNHPEVPAVARLQGETDSMGCELHDFCALCVDRFQASVLADSREGTCDRCGHFAAGLKRRRDPDEGLAGRLYELCEGCVQKSADYYREQVEADTDATPVVDDYDDDLDDLDFLEEDD